MLWPVHISKLWCLLKTLRPNLSLWCHIVQSPVHSCTGSDAVFVLLTATGNALIKCGETEKQIGGAERELIQSSAINFLTPFRNFLEGDFKTILVSWAAASLSLFTEI